MIPGAAGLRYLGISHSEGIFTTLHDAIRQTEGTPAFPVPVMPLRLWPDVAPYVTIAESVSALSFPYNTMQVPKNALRWQYTGGPAGSRPTRQAYSNG